jgi:hypothetical protein
MPGDADMSRDEMVARIAVLEAFALKLLELAIRDRQAKGGPAAVDGLIHSLGEAVGVRCHSMKEPQAQIARSHMDAMMKALAELTRPSAPTKN